MNLNLSLSHLNLLGRELRVLRISGYPCAFPTQHRYMTYAQDTDDVVHVNKAYINMTGNISSYEVSGRGHKNSVVQICLYHNGWSFFVIAKICYLVNGPSFTDHLDETFDTEDSLFAGVRANTDDLPILWKLYRSPPRQYIDTH